MRSTTLLTVLGVGAVLALAACTDENKADHFVGPREPINGVSSDFVLDRQEAGGYPGGTSAVTAFALKADTVGKPDVFARSGADGFYHDYRYYFPGGVRIASQDPRAPTLASLTDPSQFSIYFTYLEGPEWFGPPLIWDFYSRWGGLDAGEPYTYSLQRLGTKVNGALDQLEFILDGEVTQPDSLIPISPNPGGYPAQNYAWTSQAGCSANPLPTPMYNPFYTGVFYPGSSYGTSDMCMGSPWKWYHSTLMMDPDSTIIQKNDGTNGVVMQYNYAVVYKGMPPSLGPPVLRIQMGQDLDLSGNPLPNGFAPFPLDEDRSGFLALSNVAGAASRVEVKFDSLPALSGSEYSVWLYSSATHDVVPAKAEYTKITRTQTGVDENDKPIFEETAADPVITQTFNSGGMNEIHLLRINKNTLDAGTKTGDYTHVVVSIGSETPSAVPLWATYIDDNGTPDDPYDDQILDTSTPTFGRMDLSAPEKAVAFLATGGGQGGFWGDKIAITFKNLRKPPFGFYYAGWLVKEDGSAVSLGELRSPAPDLVSLKDVDIDPSLPGISEGQILEGAFAASIADVGGSWTPFRSVRLTLEPKAGGNTMGGGDIVLSGAVPKGLYTQ